MDFRAFNPACSKACAAAAPMAAPRFDANTIKPAPDSATADAEGLSHNYGAADIVGNPCPVLPLSSC
jgi:hypothetical protein